MSIINEKNLLRVKYKDIRKSLIRETTLNGESKKSILDVQVFKNLVANVDFKKYKSILVYVSFGMEVDTHTLIDYLRERNISIYAPKCYKIDSSMRFFAINDIQNLVQGQYKGILEPIEDSNIELMDFSNCLCIVPALAFDTNGYRLGWGGGYYDRFLNSNKDIFKVGLAYNSCITENIPTAVYDISVDLVVTENNILLCGGT